MEFRIGKIMFSLTCFFIYAKEWHLKINIYKSSATDSTSQKSELYKGCSTLIIC